MRNVYFPAELYGWATLCSGGDGKCEAMLTYRTQTNGCANHQRAEPADLLHIVSVCKPWVCLNYIGTLCLHRETQLEEAQSSLNLYNCQSMIGKTPSAIGTWDTDRPDRPPGVWDRASCHVLQLSPVCSLQSCEGKRSLCVTIELTCVGEDNGCKIWERLVRRHY